MAQFFYFLPLGGESAQGLGALLQGLALGFLRGGFGLGLSVQAHFLGFCLCALLCQLGPHRSYAGAALGLLLAPGLQLGAVTLWVDFDHGPAKGDEVFLVAFGLRSQPDGFGGALKRGGLTFAAHDLDAGHAFAGQGFAVGAAVAANAYQKGIARRQFFAEGALSQQQQVDAVFPGGMHQAAPV